MTGRDANALVHSFDSPGMKRARYLLEALVLYPVYWLFRLLPVDAASGLGGWIGRTLGPRTAVTRRARRQLRDALPEMSDADRRRAIRQMWDNFGRVIAEYPHLEEIGRDRTEVVNAHLVERLVGGDRPCIFISAHLANWEVNASRLYYRYHRPLHLTYRIMNNPWAERLLRHLRTLKGKLDATPKSRSSGKPLINALKAGTDLGILIDQRYAEGVPAQFFGKVAMTNPIFVQLAQKFGCQMVFAQVERLRGANFRITLHDIAPLFGEDGSPRPLMDIVEQCHRVLEAAIRKSPGQWIWTHNRWARKYPWRGKQI